MALKELVDAGTITPVIDGTYPLSETLKAIARVASGRARGTIVISMLRAPLGAASAERPPHGAPVPAAVVG